MENTINNIVVKQYNEEDVFDTIEEIKNNKIRNLNLGKKYAFGTISNSLLILYALVSFFPFFWAIFASFRNPYLISVTGSWPVPQSGGWTLENYTSIFAEGGAFTEYASIWIKNSIVYSFSAAALNATLNLLGGYALAKIAMKGKNLVVMYFIVSILVPSQATFVPTYYIFTKLGVVGLDVNTTFFLIMVIFSGMANIVLTFMARQFFLTQSPEMEEAGKMDGYGQLGIFFRITLVKMLPLFATQFVLVFMGSWNNFLTFQLYSVGDPYKMTINSGAFLIASSALDKAVGYGQALAISNISFIPMFAIYAISLKLQLRGMKDGNK